MAKKKSIPKKKQKKSELPASDKPQDDGGSQGLNTFANSWSVFFDAFKSDPGEFESVTKKACSNLITAWVDENGDAVTGKYNVLILFDEGRIVRDDADLIYSAVRTFSEDKPLLLLLHSPGGHIPPAYLISKLCRQHAKDDFVVAVPRRAKSAATLICCGADSIHMGSLSEIGPIDPQIDDLPALGLKNAIEHIADLCKRYPASSDMFSKYLNLSLDLNHLGYYERVAESAVQYAERLLSARQKSNATQASNIANKLVYEYKDHGFVIDSVEAKSIFGDAVIECDSEEYIFANGLYEILNIIRTLFGMKNYSYYQVGAVGDEPKIYKKKRRPS